VIAGQYDLLLVEGDAETKIIPDFLERTIKPGASISMQMWLPSNHRPPLPPSRFIGTPRIGARPRRHRIRAQPPRPPSYKARDAEVKDRLKTAGFEIHFATEIQRAEGSFSKVLTAFTNAPDALSELRYEMCDNHSDSDSISCDSD
jgi:hypothetical protein